MDKYLTNLLNAMSNEEIIILGDMIVEKGGIMELFSPMYFEKTSDMIVEKGGITEPVLGNDIEWLSDMIDEKRGVTEKSKKGGIGLNYSRKDIEEEILSYSSNTFLPNKSYEEIVYSVGENLKVTNLDKTDFQRMERTILNHMITKSIEKMSIKERESLIKAVKGSVAMDIINPTSVSMVAQLFINNTGFLVYKTIPCITHALAKAVLGPGLSFAADPSVSKEISLFAGPIGIMLSSAWFIFDIAGPTTRVITPVVLYLACMRQKHGK